MYCSNCGEEIDDRQSVSFCPNCGNAIAQQEAKSTESNTQTNPTTHKSKPSEATTSATPRQGPTNSTEDLPFIQGAVYGAAAYIGGYLAFILLILGIENSDVTESISSGSDFMIVGWFYHNAQFVDIDSPGQNYNLFDNEIGISSLLNLPTVLYRILPVILLLVAGYLLVSSLRVTDPTTGAKFGATIAVGVLVMAAIGAFVFSISGAGGRSSSPQLLTSILIIGTVYPAIFGGIGGYLAGS